MKPVKWMPWHFGDPNMSFIGAFSLSGGSVVELHVSSQIVSL